MSENSKSLGVVGMKFISEYSASTTYKKLQVVTDPTTGDSYGSKVDGNVGHALSDTNYWFRLTNTEAAQLNANNAATLANQKAGLADDAATLANTKAGQANDAAELANQKAGLANTAAETANNAAGKIDDMTVEGTTGQPGTEVAVSISEVSGHKNLSFTIPRGAPGMESVLVGTQISGNKYQLGIERV